MDAVIKPVPANPVDGQLSLSEALLMRPLWPLAILVPALLFIYTLPHVIALRNFVMVVLLVFVVWSLSSRRISIGWGGLYKPLALLFILHLDFIFVAGPAQQWQAKSWVVVRPGDFPDSGETSDHRPVAAVVELDVGQ